MDWPLGRRYVGWWAIFARAFSAARPRRSGMGLTQRDRCKLMRVLEEVPEALGVATARLYECVFFVLTTSNHALRAAEIIAISANRYNEPFPSLGPLLPPRLPRVCPRLPKLKKTIPWKPLSKKMPMLSARKIENSSIYYMGLFFKKNADGCQMCARLKLTTNIFWLSLSEKRPRVVIQK